MWFICDCVTAVKNVASGGTVVLMYIRWCGGGIALWQ